MMAKIVNETQKTELFTDVKIANDYRSRLQGLIGCKSLKPEEAIWFPKCNWIHTWFMSMDIDVIYLDKKMKVTKIQRNLKPWRLTAPVINARSVIETQAGRLDQCPLQIGDQIYVGD